MHELFLTLPLQLARQIGIEQALLLHQLQQWQLLVGQDRLLLSQEQLLMRLPFTEDDLADCLDTLSDLGYLQVSEQANGLCIRLCSPGINPRPANSLHRIQAKAAQAKASLHNPERLRNQQGLANWELNQLQAEQQASNEPTAKPAPPQAESLDKHWQPQADTLEILQNQGISREFALGQRAQFILWHLEKGSTGPFNSAFVGWVKKNWMWEQNDGGQRQLSAATAGTADPRTEKQKIRHQLDDIYNVDW